MRNANQSGIAIGPILFVVALIAVLASAIAAGSGEFSGDTSAVKAKAQASAILEYANEVKFAVDRVLGKGCKDTEISFENPFVSVYTNPNAPADKSCHVFDVNGGGIVWKKPPQGIDWVYSGFYDCCGRHFDGGLPNNEVADLTMILPDISLELCNELNNLIGVETIHNGGAIGLTNFLLFRGGYGWFSTYEKPQACSFSEDNRYNLGTVYSKQYHFQKNLIVR